MSSAISGSNSVSDVWYLGRPELVQRKPNAFILGLSEAGHSNEIAFCQKMINKFKDDDSPLGLRVHEMWTMGLHNRLEDYKQFRERQKTS